MRDITNRDDLDLLIRRFYKKALIDPTIGFFFTEIAEVDLDVHIPKIVSFWELMLFRTETFEGNPFRTHKIFKDGSPCFIKPQMSISSGSVLRR